jgi:hypothetical protein
VCCFAGVDSLAVGSERQSFGAEGADWSRNPFVGKRSDARQEQGAWRAVEAFYGRDGAVGRFDAKGVARAGWPWLYQKGTVTRKRARRVKVAVRRGDKRCRV